MKRVSELVFFVLVIFMLGLNGCGTTMSRLSFCLVGTEQACSDLREGYKLHRQAVTP